jgi:hypothetical protein
MSRYEGKPFLRFLDCYVLDSIGQLDEPQRLGLETMEPMLAKALGRKGSWQEMVSAQMEFSESMPEKIRQIWHGYLDRAKQQGDSVSPNEFVAEFIDQNFPEIAAN